MKILIIGGTGFVGSELSKLLSKNHEVKTLSRKGDIKCDITDLACLKENVKNFDIVFHLAAQSLPSLSIKKPKETFMINTTGTANILEACHANGIKNFVFASTSKVYGHAKYLPVDEKHPTSPLTPYAESKVEGEKLCEEYRNKGMNIKILRFFNIYGPGQKGNLLIPVIINQIKTGEIKLRGDNSKLDFVNINDVCNALEKCIDTDFSTPINIGTGIGSTPKDIIKILEKITNKKLKVSIKTDVTTHEERANNKLAKEILSWEPTITLEQGLREIVKTDPNLHQS